MLVEHLAGVLEDVEKEIKGMRENGVNITFLMKQMDKMAGDIEKLKDKQRTFSNGNKNDY